MKLLAHLIFISFVIFNYCFSQVIVNEMMPKNLNTYISKYKKPHDWIELKNISNDTIELKGWYLSDNKENPTKWRFPSKKIGPNQIILVLASGLDRKVKGEIHTNFKISSKGEPIILSNNKKKVVDKLPAKKVPAGFTLGKNPSDINEVVFFRKPTPKKENSKKVITSFLDSVTFSHEAGFYKEEFYLKLEHPDPNVTLYYTLDGSTPNEKSNVYDEPILIKNRSNEPNKLASRRTSKDYGKHKWKPPLEKVFKGTTIRVTPKKNGAISPKVYSKSYFVDPKIHSRYNLPVVSIITDEKNLISKNGIFQKHRMRGIKLEKPAHITFLDEVGNIKAETDLGIRVHGGNSRRYFLKSLRLYFRDYYGDNAIEYPKFNTKKEVKHERLILRNSGSDWRKTQIRDPFAQKLMEDVSNVQTQGFLPSIVFINGEYWGILNIRQRYDDNFIRNNYGVEKFDLIEQNRSKHGNKVEYVQLLNKITRSNLELNEKYEKVLKKIDIENFIDYHILQIFAMNTDQPVKNSAWWKSSELDKKWRWMWFDLDDTFGFNKYNDYDRNGFIFSTLMDDIDSEKKIEKKRTRKPRWAPNSVKNTSLFRSLSKNKRFQKKLINRFADLLNTVFKPEHSIPLLDSLLDLTKPYQTENYLRWHYPNPELRLENIDKIKDFLTFRNDCMTAHIVDFFNLEGYYNFSTQIEEEKGFVRINSIDIHSRTPGVKFDFMPKIQSDFWTGTYFKEIPITIEAIPEDGYIFSHWEGDFVSPNSKLELDPENSLHLKPVFINESHYISDQKKQVVFSQSPLSNFAVITFSKNLKGKKKVTIKNQFGKEVMSIITSKGRKEILYDKLPKGLYTIQVKTNDQLVMDNFKIY